MSEEEEKANAFMQEAQKKARKLFGGTSNAEEACKLYTRAANSYKMAKMWTAAGKAFTEVAKLQLQKLKNKHEGASQYVEAAKCYKKEDGKEAIKCLERAVDIYNDMGKFSIVAKHHMTIAEICESKELLDIEKAVLYYTQAADYYKSEQSTSSANRCLVKVALYAAQQEDYRKAITIYEQVSSECLESTLLKYSAREYLFRSALCNMCECSNPVSNRSVIERYIQMFPAFEGSREVKFLEKLVQALQEVSVEMFTKAVDDYNKCTKLDQWYKTLLARIKGKIAPKSIAVDKISTNSSSSKGGKISIFAKGGKASTDPSDKEDKKNTKPLPKEEKKKTKPLPKEEKKKTKPLPKEEKKNTKALPKHEEVNTNPFDIDDEISSNPFDMCDEEVGSNPFNNDEDEVSTNPFDMDEDEVSTNPFEDGDLR